MKTLITILIIINSISLSAQIDVSVQSNEFESDVLEYIGSKKSLQKYDCILVKYEDCYWYKRLYYRLVCLKEDKVSLISIYQKKKNNRFVQWDKSNGYKIKDFNLLLDSLSSQGLFFLNNGDLNADIRLPDGSIKRHFISDGVTEAFIFIKEGIIWGIEIYEPQEFYEFSKNQNFQIILKSIDIFNLFWSFKN